jgi:hypothetical protein
MPAIREQEAPSDPWGSWYKPQESPPPPTGTPAAFPPPLAAPTADTDPGRPGWPRLSGLGDRARRALGTGGPPTPPPNDPYATQGGAPGGSPSTAIAPYNAGGTPSTYATTDPYAAAGGPSAYSGNASHYDASRVPDATRFDVGQDPNATRFDVDPYATRVDGMGRSADPSATRVDQYGTPVTRVDGYPPQSPAGTLISQLRQSSAQPGAGDWPGSTQLYRKPPQQRRPPRALLIAGGAAVVVILIASFFLISNNSGSTNNTAGASSTASAKAGTGTNPAATQKHAATVLAGLLAQSVSDRAAVIDAVVNVERCGSKLAHDHAVFTRAAANRDRLLGDLSSMAGRSALPAAMLQDLTGAWQSSAAADTDMAEWTSSEEAGCNAKTVKSNADLSASYTPDGQATTDKQAFASLWNPIASKYGLTTYQPDQL